MENNQHDTNDQIPPVHQTIEDRERHWHMRNQYRMIICAVVAVIVAAIIFLAGVVLGRLSVRFSGPGYSGRSEYGRMQGHMSGSNIYPGMPGVMVSPAVPITPTNQGSTSTAVPSNK